MSMMGELNFFIELQIKQLKEGTFINQAKYIRDLLKRFNMEEAKTMKNPMSSSIKLNKDEKGKSVNSTMYRGIIGSLLYLTASRPDIMYSMAPKRETATSKAQDKRSAKPSQPEHMEARQKARIAEQPLAQAHGQGQMHPGVEEEAEIRKMNDGLDSQRDFEQREPELDIPPPPQLEGIHVEATFS
ncbi:hypothetical protein VitviT2T_028520 [Vitis vinifera]|uniref:Retrovirus-related Pol polyprotein from transposon RE1 n=1 Tax=Vitis vinifera TaxID=29760 RepID=A0ABY9DV79_VITVI|nr:hypothetical protein VitviT2T_028520 [Vitis vinifera]